MHRKDTMETAPLAASSNKADITVSYGDGVGPEIMKATLQILEAAGAEIIPHEIEVGEKVYLRGHPTGIEPKSWEIINGTQAFLKAPITTPQGGGFRSLNVTIRTALGLYANVRPCVSYYPFVETKHPKMDVVIVRENEEDLYTGIEYRQTQDAVHAIKVITRSGSERIVRYAFEYARANGRKKVTCFTKDNILKMSDGLFHNVYEAIGAEYPEIEKEHWIIDIGAAKLADSPENFDVIVLPNLYGDVLSDVAAQIAGSVGLAGSANIGLKGAMFEAIHGSAPRRANQNLANPSGLLLASIMMLEHLGKMNTAALIYNAWLKTLEEGIHTYDIFEDGKSTVKVGTKEFARAVIERLGKEPETLKAKKPGSKSSSHQQMTSHKLSQRSQKKKLLGCDVYVESTKSPNELIQAAEQALKSTSFRLSMISNRGTTVFPASLPPTTLSDEWRIRFLSKEKEEVTPESLLTLQQKLIEQHFPPTKTENLYSFDNSMGFSLTPEEQ